MGKPSKWFFVQNALLWILAESESEGNGEKITSFTFWVLIQINANRFMHRIDILGFTLLMLVLKPAKCIFLLYAHGKMEGQYCRGVHLETESPFCSRQRNDVIFIRSLTFCWLEGKKGQYFPGIFSFSSLWFQKKHLLYAKKLGNFICKMCHIPNRGVNIAL